MDKEFLVYMSTGKNSDEDAQKDPRSQNIVYQQHKEETPNSKPRQTVKKPQTTLWKHAYSNI